MSGSRRKIPQGHELTARSEGRPADRPARGSEYPVDGTIRPLVVVIGAAGTIGRGVVQALVEAGRPLVAVADDDRQLAGLSIAYPRADLTVLRRPVTSDAEALELANALRALNRAIDSVVVACAGAAGRGRLLDHPVDRLRQALEQDLLPQLAIARHLLPLLGDSGRCGRYLLVGGPGGEAPWAGYAFRSVTAAAVRMLARVLHDEACSLGVRVQLLAIDTPVSGEPRSLHECREWPSALAVGRRALQLVDRLTAMSARPVVNLEDGVESASPAATTSGRALPDVRAFLKTLIAQR